MHSVGLTLVPWALNACRLYLLAHRPLAPGAPSQGAHLSQHCCCLAWPKSGSCLLSWARYLQQQRQQQQRPLPADLLTAVGRMQQEHAAAGKHMLRLLRRAEALSQRSSGGTCAASTGNGSSSSGPTVLQAELQLVDRGLQPCGGPIHVQLTAAPELLGCDQDGCTSAAGQEQLMSASAAAAAAAATATGNSSPPAAAAGQYDACVPAAVAAVQQLLAGELALGSSSSVVLQAAVKVAEGAVQHAQQAPLQPFLAPPAGSSLKAHQFMRLEPLESGSSPGRQQRPLAAVLHAHKAAQHLALRFSCGAAPCGKQCSASGSGSVAGTCGSLSCCAHIARCMRGFCASENASVVAIDAQLRPGRQDTTWLLYVAGLQQRDRADMVEALHRHFA